MLQVLSAAQIRALAPMPRVIEALRAAFQSEFSLPARQHIGVPGGGGKRLMVTMPVFSSDGSGVVKLATVFPDNVANGCPTIHAAIVVFSSVGAPVALLDGTIVTQLRTGAASALASTYLSRSDSSHLVVIGTGALAPFMAEAHCAVRPITRVSIWGRDRGRAEAAAETVRARLLSGIAVEIPRQLDEAVRCADIVSCATSSSTPVLEGRWLKPGCFMDLVGSFSPSTRESDDEAVRRARIYVDTFQGAMAEAGDVLIPLQKGIIRESDIVGDLRALCRGEIAGRCGPDEITLFKSVGSAMVDLAASKMVVAAAAAGVHSGTRQCHEQPE